MRDDPHASCTMEKCLVSSACETVVSVAMYVADKVCCKPCMLHLHEGRIWDLQCTT